MGKTSLKQQLQKLGQIQVMNVGYSSQLRNEIECKDKWASFAGIFSKNAITR
jgi:hypothetical protein